MWDTVKGPTCKWRPRKIERADGIFKEIMTENILKVMKNINSDPRNSVNLKQNKYENTPHLFILIVKLLKPKLSENLKSA